MSDTLAQRLGVRPGDRLLILNAPERYLRLLEPPEEIHIDLGSIEGTEYDQVHLFTLDKGTVDREVPRVLAVTGPNTLLWVCYPRRGGTIISDMGADKWWDVLAVAGLHNTAMVPIETYLASMRFVRS